MSIETRRTQYGRCSYGLNAGIGGITGANTKNTFDTKKNAITGYHARKGGFHAYDFDISVPAVRIKSRPPETRVLMIESGYEDAAHRVLGITCLIEEGRAYH